MFLDSKVSPIYAFKLKHKYCKVVSIPLLKQVGEAFILLGKIFKKKKEEEPSVSKEISKSNLEKQKMQLKVINYLVLALEIALMIKNQSLIKDAISEIYNHMVPFLKYKSKPQILLSTLLYCH